LIEDSARRSSAVENRRGSLQNVERLEGVKVDSDRRDRRRSGDREAVNILLRGEAANGDEVVTRVRAVILAKNAGGVADRLLGVDVVQQVDLIARDDADRLRSLDQRDVRLGRGLRALRNIMPCDDNDVAFLRAGCLNTLAGILV